MRKRLICLGLAVLVTLGLTAALSAAPDDPYFMFSAAENTIAEFNSFYFPQTLYGELYLPHFLFTLRPEWNFQLYWNSLTRTYAVYNPSKMLVFDLSAVKAFDYEQIYDERCFRINVSGTDIFFLPAQFVCDYFDLSLSQYETDVGTMVRVKKRDNAVSDKVFASIYSNTITSRYNAYKNPPAPSPTPALPSAPVAPSVSPVIPSPSVSPSPTPEPEPTIVYLTFNGASGPWTAEILDCLDRRGVKAAFFIPEEGFEDYPDIVRRIAATHTAGLLLAPDGGYPAQARRLNAGLDAAAFFRTRLVCVPAAENDLEELTALGYHVWRESPLSADISDIQAVMAALPGALAAAPALISLPNSAETLALLPALLDAMPSRLYTLLPLSASTREY